MDWHRIPLFCSTALAARIERAESRLVADGTRAIGRRRPESAALVLPIAGGVATLSEVGSPLNKLAGVGFAEELDVKELEEIERAFAERGVPLQAEVSNLADPSVCALLSRRGYVLVGFENVLGRGLRGGDAEVCDPRRREGTDTARARAGGPRATAEDVRIERGEGVDLATWLRVFGAGFAAPDAPDVPSHESFPRDVLERVAGDMAAVDGYTRYLAWRGSAVVGVASMRRFEGVAQLCGATTLAEHRRRGVQSALLAARLSDAAREGCDVAVCTAQPGSKSHENVQKQGFDLLYARAVLVRGA